MSTDETRNGPGDDSLFNHLIVMLATSAMQHMGMVQQPDGSRTEVNLEGAQISIDLLDMLRTKTRGNLEAHEEKVITEALSSLQLLYVEATRQGAPGAEPAPPPADAGPGEATDADPVISPKPGDEDGEDGDDKVKFKKTYG